MKHYKVAMFFLRIKEKKRKIKVFHMPNDDQLSKPSLLCSKQAANL